MSTHTRKHKIIAGLSVGVVFASALFALFTKTAATSIPRSHALYGVPASKNGDTNILLLGLDSRRDANGANLPRKLLDYMHVGSSSSVGGYNTNTMIVIHIPAKGAATAISIPRDDYVNVPGLGMKKIKEAYGYAKYAEDSRLYKLGVKEPMREQQSREKGRIATIQAISQFLQIPIDHFAEVNLVGFYDLATALGGIQVCLRHAVNDKQYSGAVFLPQAKALTGGKIVFHTLPIEGYVMRNSQSVNLVDLPTVRKFTQDLFYPAPVVKGKAKASPSPKPTKLTAMTKV